MSPLLRRLPACLRALKVEDCSAALMSIHENPSLLTVAVDALLNGTTSFFRDPPVFEHLEQVVIPDLLRNTSNPGIWSVACSDGTELYSVAMLLAECDSSSAPRLLGTDCRKSALDVARKGIYPLHAVPTPRSDLALGHLIRGKSTVSIHPNLVSRAEWRQHDILNGKAEGLWDMILCRNLAIYLEREAALTMWQSLATALRPGGILVVGKAESPQSTGLIRIGPCIFQKLSNS